MNRRATTARIVLVLNLVLMATALVALFTHDHPSRLLRVAMIGGLVAFAAAIWMTFSDRPRSWIVNASAPVRVTLACLPWLLLLFLLARRGLWWTQRPPALRFLVVDVAVLWTSLWSLSRRADGGRIGGPARALLVLAGLLAVLGTEGAAFGVSPFGCTVSAVLLATAALAAAVAALGSRSATLKTFAACTATLVGLAAGEVSLRALHIGHNVQETNSREYGRRFYSLTPPRAAFVNEPKPLDEFPPALVSINSRGIRGPEIAGATDVLLIGDSMIEARQLPWEETLGPKLQEALRRRDQPLRVVAHGMRGWSPLLEWNWYLKVGRSLHPRTVLLFFFWNDLWTAGDEASTFDAAFKDGQPDHFDVPIDPHWIWYTRVRLVAVAADVLQRLSVAEVKGAFTTAARYPSGRTLDDRAADRLARSLVDPPFSQADRERLLSAPLERLTPDLQQVAMKAFWPGLRPLSIWTDAQQLAAARTEDELSRFASDVQRDGGRFAIVYVPNPLQVGSQECSIGRLFERVDTGVLMPEGSGIQDWLGGVAQRHGFPLLDPTRAMRQYEATAAAHDHVPLYLRADCHWSADGHQFMADYLAAWLARETQLPPRTAPRSTP